MVLTRLSRRRREGTPDRHLGSTNVRFGRSSANNNGGTVCTELISVLVMSKQRIVSLSFIRSRQEERKRHDGVSVN